MDYGSNLTSLSGNARFDVAVVEPDARLRLRLVGQLPGAWQLESVQELVQQFKPGRPLVAVFGPGLANPFGLQQINRLSGAYPEIAAVIAVEALSTELLQQALRAGVRDTVDLSGPADVLHASVSRVGELVASGNRLPTAPGARPNPGRLVVVFSPKGGVGKSTVATNVAVLLAQRSNDAVVLVDGDLQFGDVAVLLSLPPQHTVIDAAAAIQYSDPELLRSLLAIHDSGLLVLPAPVEPVLGDVLPPDSLVAVCAALQGICGWVVVDCPTRFDDAVFALIDAADDVLLVGSMDIPSIKSLKIGMQALNLGPMAGPKLRLVLNRANAQVKLDIREIEQLLGLRAEHPIPSAASVPISMNSGVPVVLHDPRSPVAVALERIAETLIGAGATASVRNKRFWQK